VSDDGEVLESWSCSECCRFLGVETGGVVTATTNLSRGPFGFLVLRLGFLPAEIGFSCLDFPGLGFLIGVEVCCLDVPCLDVPCLGSSKRSCEAPDPDAPEVFDLKKKRSL